MYTFLLMHESYCQEKMIKTNSPLYKVLLAFNFVHGSPSLLYMACLRLAMYKISARHVQYFGSQHFVQARLS